MARDPAHLPNRPAYGRVLACRKMLLSATVTQTLRTELEAGRWSGDLPSERKLCEILQVSRVTLRPALIELERLGWLCTEPGRRRRIAKQIAPSRTPAAGRNIVMISPLTLQRIEPFVLLGLDHLRELLARGNMLLKTETRPECFGPSPARSLERLVRDVQADVWLLWHSTCEMQEWFHAQALKHVVVGSAFNPLRNPAVDLDHVATARHAAGSFARLGHRRVAVIVPDSNLAGDNGSIEGFSAGAAKFTGGALQVDVVRHDGSPEGLVRAIDRVMRFEPRPTGIFSAGGVQTIGIMTRLLQSGFQVPHDVSIISRDDDPALDFVSPSPARYFRPPIKFARGLFRLIKRQVTGFNLEPSTCFIFPDFLAKATLARPRRQRPG